MPGTGPSALWMISFNPQQPQRCEVLLSLLHFTEVRLPAQTTTGMPNPICGAPKASFMMTTLHCLSEQKLERRLHKTQEPIAPASAWQSFPSSRSLLLVEDRLDTAPHAPGVRNGSSLLGLVSILDFRGTKQKHKRTGNPEPTGASEDVNSGETEITEGVGAARNSLGKLLTIQYVGMWLPPAKETDQLDGKYSNSSSSKGAERSPGLPFSLAPSANPRMGRTLATTIK